MIPIVTITINPCVDMSVTIPQLIPEKKLHCSEPVYEPGGGGINVGRAVKKLGGDSFAFFLAGGSNGELLDEMLDEERLPHRIIKTRSRTRENMIVRDLAANVQYRFNMPGPAIFEEEWKQLLSTLEKIEKVEYMVASGSITEGVPVDIFGKISDIAKRKSARFIVDSSGPALKQALEHGGVYLIKPSINELSALIGAKGLNADTVAAAARQIISRGRCEVVVVSMGPGGAMLITKDIAETITPPPSEKKSVVGAGDSMVAGIVLSLARGRNIQEALRYGVASGTAATMNAGTELCRLEDAEMLYEQLRKNSVLKH